MAPFIMSQNYKTERTFFSHQSNRRSLKNSSSGKQLNNLLLLSFDLIREAEPIVPYAIGSILSYLRKSSDYLEKFAFEHVSINMLQEQSISSIKSQIEHFCIADYDYIALSAYIWNEFWLHDIIFALRNDLGFTGDFILGGYQITYSDNPMLNYPDCKYFISGHGEKALLDIITEQTKERVLSSEPDFHSLPSPYLNGDIPLGQNQKMVRMETRRGCIFSCSFCAHRDLKNGKVYQLNPDRVYAELELFQRKQVQKVNILDPIFNAGPQCLQILEEMQRISFSPKVSIQTRFEKIRGGYGKRFLQLCEGLDIHFEFGLQTAIEEESELINRKNRMEQVEHTMQELNNRNISYEVSLIYGLPTQTLDSFQRSINFLQENGCKNIKAFPLMLLRGTRLSVEREKYGFKEKPMGEFQIPTVVESDSFTEKEWLQMKEIAERMMDAGRV